MIRSRISIVLIMLGLFLIIAGIVISSGSVSKTQTTTGGVIFIGPVPIVFGSGPGYPFLVIVGVLITFLIIASLLVTVILSRRNEHRNDDSIV
ncbi:MAG: DUF131 domain-containing protein [Nitrososphaerota archaeon]|nr:DUF131 domain-containing protein [Nitrososphaerota archaeon]